MNVIGLGIVALGEQRHRTGLARGIDRNARHDLTIAPEVVDDVDRAAIGRELAGRECRSFVRRQQDLLVRLQVVQVQVGVAARDEAPDQRAVRGPLDVVDAAEPAAY